jgi:hypothetical protein
MNYFLIASLLIFIAGMFALAADTLLHPRATPKEQQIVVGEEYCDTMRGVIEQASIPAKLVCD